MPYRPVTVVPTQLPKAGRWAVMVVLVLIGSLLNLDHARAATFEVSANRIDDLSDAGDDLEDTDPVPDGCTPADCSLREAVIAANGAIGPDTITFADRGQVTLTLVPAVGGDGPDIWDLDIVDPLTILGPDPDNSLIIRSQFGFTGPDSRLIDATAELDVVGIQMVEATVAGDGGLIATSAPLSVRNSLLTDGEAFGHGGAIKIDGSSLELVDSSMSNNTGRTGGGALSADDFTSIDLTNTLVSGNQAFGNDGGAIHASGVDDDALLAVTESGFFSNQTPDAPDFPNNGRGGAIFIDGGRLTVDATLLQDNGAVKTDLLPSGTKQGGAVHATAEVSSVQIQDAVFASNNAVTNGGAVYVAATEAAVNRTLVSDTVTGDNAAVHVGGASTVTMANTTISGSTAAAVTALYVESNASADIAFSTISDSHLSPALALLQGSPAAVVADGGLRLNSTVISGHDDLMNCVGEIVSQNYNISDDDTCGLTETDDLSDTDPVVGVLTDHDAPQYGAGGLLEPSQTHRPGPGSPALDSADPVRCGDAEAALDQRLVDRPQGAACDRGAHEVLVDVPPPPSEECDESAVDGPAPVITTGINRIEGLNRIQTAIAASRALCKNGQAPAVVLTRADLFPDAQAGTPLAIDLGAPLLLTNPESLDPDTEVEIQRVLAAGGDVYLLGGTVALSDAVQDRLETIGYATTPYGGVNRFDTAAIIAADGLDNPATLLVANGGDFADSIVAGAAALAVGDGSDVQAGVLLTSGSDVPPETQTYLDARPDTPELIAIGATAAAAFPAAEQISGPSRFETAVAVADRFFTNPSVIGIARSDDFADGLTGGAVVGRAEIGPGPMILVSTDELPATVQSWLESNAASIDTVVIFGGTAAVNSDVESAVAAAIGE